MAKRRTIIKRCSQDSWHACLEAMNLQKPQVKMKTVAVEDVARCHRERGGDVSRDLVVRPGKRHAIVDRQRLWELVQAHGQICR